MLHGFILEKWVRHLRRKGRGVGYCKQKKQQHEQNCGLLKGPDVLWDQGVGRGAAVLTGWSFTR